jgi:NitT/TauT family transport system substrate-binding protein
MSYKLLRKNVFVLFFVTVMLFVTASGCENLSKNTSSQSYRIGLGPWIGFGPIYLAREKGFFKEVGIQPELTVITGLAERNSALKAGRIDALAAPVDYFVLSAGNNLKTTTVMAIDESVGGDGIVAKKSIKSFKELKGKKVAFQRGLPGEFFLRVLLQNNGMVLEDIKPVDMETAQAGAAFIAGQVDAAVVWEPWLSKATEKGNGFVLASTKQYPNIIVDCLAFNQSVVEKAPQDVQKIVNAIFKAIAYWEKNPDESNKIMAPFFEVNATKYAAILSGARFTNSIRNREYFGTKESPGAIFEVGNQASNVWLKAKAINSPVDSRSIISTDFVNKQ